MHKGRVKKVLSKLEKNNIDLLIVSKPENIYYLTNYQTVGNPIQVLLISRIGLVHLITRELEATNVKYRCNNVSYSYYNEKEDEIDNICNYIKALEKVYNIGMEYSSDRLSYQSTVKFHQTLSDYNFHDCSTLISKIRVIKSEQELEYMRNAAYFSQEGIKVAVNYIKPDMMESEIAGVINKRMMELGCEYTAYPCFMAAGKNGCMGHYTAQQTRIKDGDILFMEVGGCYKRYHAARMHTIYVGRKEPEYFKEARYLIKSAIRSVKDIMKPNVKCSMVDKYMRDIISNYSYPFKQSERSGYSIGIGFYTDWAENDILKLYPRSEAILKENMTLHLIPWIQLPEIGAIGFSDTVFITKDGAKSLYSGESPVEYPWNYDYITKVPSYGLNETLRYLEEELGNVLKYYVDIPKTDLIMRDDILGINKLYIKDESMRLGQKAFKILGTNYALNKLKEVNRLTSTLTTMTDGNHGTALAYLANKYGYKCVIYVPNNMVEERINVIKSYGAECIITEGTYDDAIEKVKDDVLKNNWTLISDTSWDGYDEIPRYITSGYMKIFDEVYEEVKDITHVFLQVGVGGFAVGGIGYILQKVRPIPKIICVEPTDADSLMYNVCHPEGGGKCVSDKKIDSIMAGLNCGTISGISWETLRDNVDLYLTIGDNWARKAMCDMYHNKQRVYAGESGCAGYAGLLVVMQDKVLIDYLGLNGESNVLVVNTEGITDMDNYCSTIHG